MAIMILHTIKVDNVYSYFPFWLYEMTNQINHSSNMHVILLLSLDLMMNIHINIFNLIYMLVYTNYDLNLPN